MYKIQSDEPIITLKQAVFILLDAALASGTAPVLGLERAEWDMDYLMIKEHCKTGRITIEIGFLGSEDTADQERESDTADEPHIVETGR